MDKKLWLQAADEAMDKEFQGNYEIWGGDLDPAAVELARHNAALAEVGRRGPLRCGRRPHLPLGRPVRPDGHQSPLRRADHGAGRRPRSSTGPSAGAWSKFPEGWKLYLLSSHTEFERTFGKKADKKRKLYNGMLKCDLFMYL